MTHSIQSLKLKIGLVVGGCLALLSVNSHVQALPLAVGWTFHELAWGLVAVACLNLAFQLLLAPKHAHTGPMQWLSTHIPATKVSLAMLAIGLIVGTLIDHWLS
ncbi:hypothetical protein [Lactiplantibacillus pingfangensis]|uniref:hypothetical protein n=1 Tax=Lactiplantibacillus pingfangensis TaxID=2559915 RepID=UPI0010F71653|nr:hypothetical protein [Lactiplantibacillus pingfangensis]